MSPQRPPLGVVATLVVLCLLCSLGATAPAVSAQSASVSVTNATHSPTTPAVGDTFEVTATIRNQVGAESAFTINEVAVEVPGRGPAGYSNARDLGTLTPGSEIQVSLPATVTETGWHQLRVLVYGQTETGRAVNIAYPVTVQVVDRQRPQLDLDYKDGVVGAESTVELTVANGLSDSVRNLRVELTGDAVEIDRPTRVRSALAGEAEANYTFNVTPGRAGDRQLTARLTYTDASGTTRTVTEQFRYPVDSLESEVRLDVSAVRGETPAVDVTVVNLGNAAIEDVTVTGETGETSLSTTLLDRIGSRGSETVRLNVTDLAAADTELTVRADYEVGGERREVTRTVSGAFVPGRIDLTGIDVAPTDGGRVRITGTASNVGTTRVQAVTVRVLSTPSVTPSNPGKEYFVGSVDASDFSSFTVTAQVADDNATTIPLEVTYLVASEERSRTVEATYDPPETPERSGSGFPLVGVGVVLAVVVAGVFLWRRRHDA